MKTPQERGTSDEEAEAMPVESEPAVAEIHFYKTLLALMGKSICMIEFLEVQQRATIIKKKGMPFFE